MEFCPGMSLYGKADVGGGIIDLLNKRLRDRLKEIEILNIFTDVCEVRQSLIPADGRLLRQCTR